MCAVAVGMMFALAKLSMPPRGSRVLATGVVAALVCAAICAYIRNTTRLMESGVFNLTLIFASVVVLVIFVVFEIGPIKKATRNWGEWVREIALAAFAFISLVYTVQYTIGYIKVFLDAEGTAFSTGFLYDLIGWAAGIALCLVAAVAVNRCAIKTNSRMVSVLLIIVMLLLTVRYLGAGVQTMIQHMMIRSNPTLFMFMQYTTNGTNVFIFITMVVAAIIPVYLWVRSFHVDEPYRNPAQHRKIKAKWRNSRRWGAAFIVCIVLVMLNLTVLYDLDNQAITLSPVEESQVDEANGVVIVNFDQVSDGHLHRFAYNSPSGVEVRFIIIQKPNSTTYGVGMDSCDICGEAGYYERDGQVICKKCDVVMNINTIGFPGGCNPKVVDYVVKDGTIQLSIDSIMQYEKDFK